jgi:hypothetical protein
LVHALSDDSIENRTLRCRVLFVAGDFLVAQPGEFLQRFGWILGGGSDRSGGGGWLRLKVMDLSGKLFALAVPQVADLRGQPRARYCERLVTEAALALRKLG